MRGLSNYRKFQLLCIRSGLKLLTVSYVRSTRCTSNGLPSLSKNRFSPWARWASFLMRAANRSRMMGSLDGLKSLHSRWVMPLLSISSLFASLVISVSSAASSQIAPSPQKGARGGKGAWYGCVMMKRYSGGFDLVCLTDKNEQ